MKKLAILCMALTATAFIGARSVALASLLQVGDTVHFHDAPGNNGGVFEMYEGARHSTDVFVAKTFCVQTFEGLRFSGQTIDGISKANDDTALNGGPKPIGDQVVWLYNLFLDDLLQPLAAGSAILDYTGAGYDLPDTDAGNRMANSMQKFIWEGMALKPTNAVSVNDASFYRKIQGAWDAVKGSYVNPGNVVILNFRGRQDQLYRTPEPLSIAVWSILGLSVAAWRIRKRQ